MDKLQLEPYAVRVRFSRVLALQRASWDVIAAGFLEAVGRLCASEGRGVIGHIKGLILGEAGAYLRISVTDAARPAHVEGSVSETEDRQIMTLNALVINLAGDRVAEMVRKAADDPVIKEMAEITVLPALPMSNRSGPGLPHGDVE